MEKCLALLDHERKEIELRQEKLQRKI